MKESGRVDDERFGVVQVQSHTCTLVNHTADLTVFTLVSLVGEQLTETAFIVLMKCNCWYGNGIFNSGNRRRNSFPLHLE